MTRRSSATLVLLAGWLGGALLVATAVAPAAFRVLPTRTLAGALVGEVLPVVFVAGLLVAVASYVLDTRVARESLDNVVRTGLVVMALGCISAQFTIAPKIATLRAGIGAGIESLAPTDPRRIRFGRLHMASVLLMGAAMVGASTALGRKLYIRS